MKKNLLLLSFFIITFTQLKATDWFPIGAKWSWDYTLCCPDGPYTEKWVVEKDTIIGIDTFQILNQVNYHTNSVRRLIIKEENNKVYRWLNNELLPICDFTKSEHDTCLFVAPYSSNILDSFFYIIDSIRPLQQNSTIKVQYGILKPKTTTVFPSYHLEIKEKACFWGFTNSSYFLSTEPPILNLRCYQDTELSINFSSLACDSILALIKEKYNNQLQIEIYPNPISDKILIEYYGTKNYQKAEIIILDINGKIIKPINLIDNMLKFKEISLSDVLNGIYFLKISIDDEFTIKKIIVNH